MANARPILFVAFALPCFLLLVATPVASQGIVNLAGGAPRANQDLFELLDGRLTQQLVDEDGNLHNLTANLSRIDVLFNDIILGYTPDSCYEPATLAQKRPSPKRLVFEESTAKLGIKTSHRTQMPARPYCLFHYEVPNRNGSGVSRLEGEFCMPEHLTGSVAAADYDGDGLVDLFFTDSEGPSSLYRNLGTVFEDVTSAVGLGPARYGSGAVWADVDADGDLDLYVTTVGDSRHYLYINKKGVFKEDAIKRNMDLGRLGGRRLSGMTPNAGDYDRDGYPDIYVAEWSLQYFGSVSASQLMHNKGKTSPGYFEDTTHTVGVATDTSYTFCSSFTDMDNDGWADIIVTADYGDTKIFWSNKDGTFTECTKPCGVTVRADAMGHAMADWNMDGKMDWWMTAIHGGNQSVNCEVIGCTFLEVGNLFYRNNGDRTLTDYTDKIGVREGYWGWGNAMLDFNNDRWIDFVMTNGFDTASTTADDQYKQTPSRLWENRGPKYNLSTVERAGYYGINHTQEGRGLAKVDIDDDGDEDIIIVNAIGLPSIYMNHGGNRKEWLKIRVKHTCPNDVALLCDSLGARVYVTSTDGYTQMQEVGSGSQYMAQNELTAHFGLGDLASNVEVRIVWPWLGKTLNVSDVLPNSRLRVVAPKVGNETLRSFSSLHQCPKVTLSSVSKPSDGVNASINSDNRTISIQLPSPESGETGYTAPDGTISFNYTVQISPAPSPLSSASQFSSAAIVIATSVSSISADLMKSCKKSQHVADRVVPALSDRAIDGFGNNQKNPVWGATGANLRREVQAVYVDGVDAPSGQCTHSMRVAGKCTYPLENAKDGSVRPSPRNISNVVFQQVRNVYSARGLSDMHTHFGQFLAHDTDFSSPLPKFEFEQSRNDVWFPISIPKGDVHFDPYNEDEKFMSFIRTTYSRCTGRVFKQPREQFNKISSIIDATNVYGDVNRLKDLRTFKNGKLLLDTIKGETFIPFNRFGLANDNPVGRQSKHLLVAGDTRANAQPGLVVLHTLFAREHNRLCDQYLHANPGASDSDAFAYAHKIVIAEMQAITFREYLPALLGAEMSKYTGYVDTVDPSVSNIFATAAFRFGHSQVNTHMWRFDENGTVPHVGHVALREAYFAPERVLSEGGIDPYLRGMVEQRAQEIDTLMVDDMRNVLFPVGRRDGLDLTALNIQRGRDHGIADFNAVRKSLKLKFYQDIAQISKNSTVVSQLKSVYPSVDVIDPWVGGLAEDHVNGSELGEFFHNIIVSNFEAIRAGDRFWYERILNQSEIDMVHNLTLSKIVALNTGVATYPENAFFATRYCKSARSHQCVPVATPTCPSTSTASQPASMATSVATSMAHPTDPPSTATDQSFPDLPTAPTLCTTPAPLPTQTASPCCDASLLCAANLTSVQGKLNGSLLETHNLRQALGNRTSQLATTGVQLSNCSVNLTAVEDKNARLTRDASGLQSTIALLKGKVVHLEQNLTNTTAQVLLAEKDIAGLHLKIGFLEKGILGCQGNSSQLLGQCLLDVATVSATPAQKSMDNTALSAALILCQAQLAAEIRTSATLGHNLTQAMTSSLATQLQCLADCGRNMSSLQLKLASANATFSRHLSACQAALSASEELVLMHERNNTNISLALQELQQASRMAHNQLAANLSGCEGRSLQLRQQLQLMGSVLNTSQQNITVCEAGRKAAEENAELLRNQRLDCTAGLGSCSRDRIDCEASLVRCRNPATGAVSSAPPPPVTTAAHAAATAPGSDPTADTPMATDQAAIPYHMWKEYRARYERNLTWHRQQLHNLTSLYSTERSRNQDLELQLQVSTGAGSESQCNDGWTMILFSYEGRVMIGLAAGFLLTSLVLAATLCGQYYKRRSGAGRVKNGNATEIAFTKRKYSTTERPILMSEFQQDTMY